MKEDQRDLVSNKTSVKFNKAVIMLDLLNPEVAGCG